MAVESSVATSEDDAETVLLLPRNLALVRSLQLPSTAASRLRDVVRFEIERQTPFTQEQVYFDAVPDPAFRRGKETLSVTLVVVPRARLDAAVESAATHTTRLVAVDITDAIGNRFGANLLPAPSRYRRPELWRRWNIALSLVCMIAFIGLLIGLLHARERGVTELTRQTETILAQASDVEQRAAVLGEARRLSEHLPLADSPTALELLSQLSATLPTDSHFIQIELDAGVITARGQTRDLPAVLSALGKSSLWGTPELTGSRTLPEGDKQEFSLRLRLRNHVAVRDA